MSQSSNQVPNTEYQIPSQAALQHVAIIMDGNGRWAINRGMPRLEGHRRGAEALRKTLKACADNGVKWLTVYAFSSENWNRPADEVQDLMGLLKHYIKKELATLHKEQVRIRFIGDRSKLSEEIQRMLAEAEEKTAKHERFNLNVALSYGSKQELARACQQLAHKVAEGTVNAQDISEKDLEAHLYTSGVPELDLLIRTGGEQRLSNFLLWQLAYTELYFTDTLWPDFAEQDLKDAIDAFGRRERRYGTT